MKIIDGSPPRDYQNWLPNDDDDEPEEELMMPSGPCDCLGGDNE